MQRNRNAGLRERIVGYRADPHLAGENVSARIAAYVYGNIIIFAALVPIDRTTAEQPHALALVIGAALTTFLAHLFAEVVGQGAGIEEGGRIDLRHELRNSLPIASSAVVPCLLLLLAVLGVLEGRVALVAADVYLLVRIALVGLVVERLRARPVPLRGLLSGVVLAVLAAGIAVAKVVLSH